MISNRIFCISQTDDEVYFVEWDFQGNERRRVLVSELISSNGMIEVNISDNHYLAFLKFKAGLKKCTVFTFNLKPISINYVRFNLDHIPRRVKWWL